MRAKGWHGGPASKSGAGYGIRISEADRDAHFDPEWSWVRIKVGAKWVAVEVSVSFWENCPELRSKEIGEYMLAEELAPWPKGKPPVFDLIPDGDRCFRLEGLGDPIERLHP